MFSDKVENLGKSSWIRAMFEEGRSSKDIWQRKFMILVLNPREAS